MAKTYNTFTTLTVKSSPARSISTSYSVNVRAECTHAIILNKRQNEGIQIRPSDDDDLTALYKFMTQGLGESIRLNRFSRRCVADTGNFPFMPDGRSRLASVAQISPLNLTGLGGK